MNTNPSSAVVRRFPHRMNHTPNLPSRRGVAAILLAAMAALPSAGLAASASWTSATSGNWSTGPWSAAFPNGAGETATFSQNWTGQTVTVDGDYTVGGIVAADTTSGGGGLTLGGTGTLTLSGGAKPVIQTDAGLTENSWLNISAVLAGANGFDKQGIGYLKLSGANTFVGSIKMTGTTGGSFLVVNSDAALGSASNTIDVATSTGATGFYNEASAGAFTLNSNRTITTTGTGDFWVKNKSGANMTIAGVISGTANFRKNDAGIVTLTNANTYAGVTRLDGGTLRLSGGSNRLPTTTSVVFNSASTLDLTNTTQSVAAITAFGGGTSTITGSGGSLTVTNDANFTVNGADATTLDMSGLTNFTFNRPARNFVVQPVTNGTTATNTINLAKAGTNGVTAAALTVGGASGTSQGTAHEGRLGLGTANNFNVNTVNLGGFNGSGLVSFQSGLTNPVLTLRGVSGGTSRVDNIFVGSTSSGVRSGDGVLNLTGGTLDALATNVIVGRHAASANNTVSSSITMPGGSLDTVNLVLGRKSTNLGSGVDTTGTPTINATFTQGGGSVKVSNLTMGENTNADTTTILPNLAPTYNLNGGTLFAASIDGGAGGFGASSVRNLNLNGGTLRNFDASTSLTVDGVSGTASGRVNIVAGASGGTVAVDAGRTVTFTANTRLTGSGVITKSGEGAWIIASSTNSADFTGGVALSEGGLKLGAGTDLSTFSAGSFTWNGGTLHFDLSGASGSDKISLGAGAFNRGAGLASGFVFDFGGGGEAGGEYRLASFGSFGGTFAFEISNLAPGLVGSLSIQELGAIDDLVLTVSAIPEPSAFGVLVGLGALGYIGACRRRRA